MPGRGVGNYTVTMLYNSRILSRDVEEIALNGQVASTKKLVGVRV